MEETIITSTQNAKVKHVVALQQKSALRRKEGLFVVEGRRELMHCLEAGYEVAELFVLGDRAPLGSLESLASLSLTVTPQVYEKMAYRGSTEGVIAVVREKHLSLDDLQLSKAPLVMVLERVEKPGNLGAVLRSADAAKADAVIVCDPLTDLYNPNLIRSSIGAIFSVPCVACSSEECIAFLKARGIQILTAQRGMYCFPEGAWHTDTDCATAGFQSLLRYGYAARYSHCHGDGIHRSYRPMATGCRCPYTHSDVGTARLAECQCQCGYSLV